jgi:hypothetical protein
MLSPATQQQVLARAIPLADGPRFVLALADDPSALLSFPAGGGTVTLPLVAATRNFYSSTGWKDARARMQSRNKSLLSQNPAFALDADPNTLYRSIASRLSGWWFDDAPGFPEIYHFNIPRTAETPRESVGQWALAIKLERPKYTGRQAVKFIMRRPDKGLFGDIMGGLGGVTVWVINKVKDLFEALKPLVCGPAKPYIDDFIVLVAGGPAALGVKKMAELSKATGKSEAELTKTAAQAAADPKSAAIEQITNLVVSRLCSDAPIAVPADTETPPPPPLAPPAPGGFPPGSVAVFDTSLNQYRIVTPTV